MYKRILRKREISRWICRAIDTYPGGICFATTEGRVILANAKINQLSVQLFGQTILNAERSWTQITEMAGQQRRSGMQTLQEAAIGAPMGGAWPQRAGAGRAGREVVLPLGDICYLSLPDGTIWQFHRQMLDERAVQIDAADVTELYLLNRELYDRTRQLREQKERQQALLKNIVQVNQDKELLSMKMRVHDEFGHCLVATDQFLQGLQRKTASDPTEGSKEKQGDLCKDREQLCKFWEKTLRAFSGIPEEQEDCDGGERRELLQAASLIGCQIHFEGEMPTAQKTLHLLYASVREALTNAVRHAEATELCVTVQREATRWHISIQNNGRRGKVELREGTGLRALRQRLEREGAMLYVDGSDGVTMTVVLPNV